MDRRLGWLAGGLAASIVLAAFLPLVAPAVALLLPAASIAWALRASPAVWAVAMLPAGAAVALTAPEGLGAFLASVVCGPVIARVLAAGRGLGGALAAGAVPLAVWTVVMAVTGFDPFPEGTEESFEAIWRDVAVPADRLAELRASSETALAVLRSTWVASEIMWYWVTLVAAWWFLGRLRLRSGPEFGPLARFDVPDAWIGVLIAGLVAVLGGGQMEAEGVARVGWNLVFGAGFVFAVRGVAVQTDWMERAGWKRPVRVGVFGVGFVLAMPVFLSVGALLGLFDAWFDFRKLRTENSGG